MTQLHLITSAIRLSGFTTLYNILQHPPSAFPGDPAWKASPASRSFFTQGSSGNFSRSVSRSGKGLEVEACSCTSWQSRWDSEMEAKGVVHICSFYVYVFDRICSCFPFLCFNFYQLPMIFMPFSWQEPSVCRHVRRTSKLQRLQHDSPWHWSHHNAAWSWSNASRKTWANWEFLSAAKPQELHKGVHCMVA